MPALFLRFAPKSLSMSVLLAALVVTTGCGSNATTPTTPEPPSVTQVFNGSLALNGSTFYSFTTTQTGTISFVLTKVQVGGVDVTDQVTLGLGSPRQTDCAVSTSVAAAAGIGTLLSGSQGPGVYCVRVWDAGILTKPVTFSVNINRPTQ